MNFTVTLLLLLLLLLYLMLNSLILLCIKPYGTLYNNNDPADNIPISTVVIQDSLYKHNIHHEITSHIPLELPIPKFTATESTDELERKTFTKKNVPTIPNQKVHRTLPHPNNPNRHTCSFANSTTKTKTTPSSHKPYPMYQQQN